jgi:D-aminopeptidase
LGTGAPQIASPREPVLEMRKRAVSGAPIHLRLFAPAGSSATLLVGDHMSITPTTGTLVPVLTNVLQSVAIGPVPASEVVACDVAVGQQGVGALVVVQAQLTLPNGAVMRSNSLPIVYR